MITSWQPGMLQECSAHLFDTNNEIEHQYQILSITESRISDEVWLKGIGWTCQYHGILAQKLGTADPFLTMHTETILLNIDQ